MTAYIEYVILDNFVVTYCLAALTYRLFLEQTAVLRSVAAACVGTAVAVFYPFVSSDWALWAIKIGLWLLLGAILFAGKRRFLLRCVTFLGLTFGFGGIIFAVRLAFSGSVSAAMRVSMFDFPIFAVIGGIVAGAAMIKRLALSHRKLRDARANVMRLRVRLLGTELDLRGLMDTGNRLYDGVTGLPVVIVGAKSLVGKISDEQFGAMISGHGERLGAGAHYMTISTAAGGSRKILLVKADEFILYSGTDGNIFNDVMVGVSFSPVRDGDEYDAILHPALL